MLRRAAALKSIDDRAESDQANGNGRQTKDQLRATLRAKGYLKGE